MFGKRPGTSVPLGAGVWAPFLHSRWHPSRLGTLPGRQAPGEKGCAPSSAGSGPGFPKWGSVSTRARVASANAPGGERSLLSTLRETEGHAHFLKDFAETKGSPGRGQARSMSWAPLTARPSCGSCDRASGDRATLLAPGPRLGSSAAGTNNAGLRASATEAERREEAAGLPAGALVLLPDPKTPDRAPLCPERNSQDALPSSGSTCHLQK